MTVHTRGIENGTWMDVICHSNPTIPRGKVVAGPFSILDNALEQANSHDMTEHKGKGTVVVYRYNHYSELGEARDKFVPSDATA